MRVLTARGTRTAACIAELSLPFELRARTRVLAHTADGEAVGVMLERGGPPLRDGDVLVDADGACVRVRAAPEALLHVTAQDPTALARIAYHLGNRHVKVEVGAGWLRLAQDEVLRTMLLGLGATVEACVAPFSPEAGAYGGGHHHSHGQDEGERYAPRIHDFAVPRS